MLIRLDAADGTEQPGDARRWDELRPWPMKAPHRRDSDGALLAEGVVAREGVLTYQLADGSTRRELVTMDALRSMAASLGRSSMTLEHPPEFVSPDNVQRFGTGDVDGEVTLVEDEAQGGFVSVKVAIRRADAIADFESGTRTELSPGYAVVLDETPGEHPQFGRYDAKQVGRTSNHLAQVGTARGGPTVRLRADSLDAVCFRADTAPPPPKRTTMNPNLIRLAALLGLSRTDSEDAVLGELEPTVKSLKARADQAEEMEKKADEEKEKVDEMQEQLKAKDAEIEKLTGERDALKEKVDQIEAAEKERGDAAELERVTALAKGIGIRIDGVDLPTLRLTVARTAVKDLPDDASAARIDGILEVIAAGKTTDDRYDGWRGPKVAPPTPPTRTDDEPQVPSDPWARHDAAHEKIHGGAL